MFTLEQQLPRPPPLAPADVRDPTALLVFIAGEHAHGIARLWPAPHGEFFALPAARRHLAAIGLARVRVEDFARLRVLIERAPMRDALDFVFGRPPRGLARVLAHLGETHWPWAAYDRLVALLHEPAANLVLRHAVAIDAAFVTRLALLPPALREARIVRNIPHEDAAVALADAFAVARWINPRRDERDLVRAWARAADTIALFQAAIAAMKPTRFAEAGPAPTMQKPYRRIVSGQALAETALRFRNCLNGYAWEIGAGQLAIYVWEGQPAAVVALKRDVGGWRFAEALGAENTALPEDALHALMGDFARVGVRIGQPVRMIEDRLEAIIDAHDIVPQPPQTLALRLGLGQLWR